MKTFYTKVDKNSNKKMYEFLKNHFTYYTMNSWNGLESIANNMKLYNLGLSDWEKALELLEIDDWYEINCIIDDFNYSHNDYRVFGNGRSGGYLVLASKHSNKNILPIDITNSSDYEEFKEWLKDDDITLKDYHSTLVELVEIVQKFDKLCDSITRKIQYMIDNARIKEEEYTEIKTRKYLEYKEG